MPVAERATPSSSDAPAAPLLQRLGTAYLRRRSATLPAAADDDEVYILDIAEQRALLSIERAMIARALVAGALSGAAAALAELAAAPLQNAAAGWRDNLGYWGVVVGVTALATLFEIAYLYWDSLRSVHDLARAAGVRLFAGAEGTRISPLATALTRAALEMPTPPGNEFEVDPHREVSKLRLLVASLLYKAKISVTSFLLKALLRRALGRAALRVWLVFVGVPVCAVWNAIVAFLVIRQARLRAMGPSAAKAYLDVIFAMSGQQPTSAETAAVLWLAVGTSVVRTHELHANHLALMRELHRRVPRPEDVDVNDSAAFLRRLKALDETSCTQALALLSVAAVVDGRVTRDERRLLAEAHAAAGRQFDIAAVRRLRRCFTAGREVDDKLLG